MASIDLGRAVAEVVTDLSRRNGISRHRLSDLTGIPHTTLSRRMVNGDFNITELLGLARELDTTPEQILKAARELTQAVAS